MQLKSYLLLSIFVILKSVESLTNESYTFLNLSKNKPCDGPPYLYVTFHDKYSNIFKYSRNGCLIQTDVLSGGPLAAKGISKYTELRYILPNLFTIFELSFNQHHRRFRSSMMFGKYKGEEALYLADASNRASSVLLYGGCVGNTGKRKFIQTVANSHKSPGVAHTYGLCTDMEGSSCLLLLCLHFSI